MKWITCLFLVDTKHDTFADAFKAMHKGVVAAIKGGGLSMQTLETACWIKQEDWRNPIMFFEARDLAYEFGLLKDGKPTGLADAGTYANRYFRKRGTRYSHTHRMRRFYLARGAGSRSRNIRSGICAEIPAQGFYIHRGAS